MIGYHYTSAENYEQIKVEGLIPYPLTNPNLVDNPLIPSRGIWVYCHPQPPLSHAGCIVWQAVRKKTDRVAYLRVAYSFLDRLSPEANQEASFWPGRLLHTLSIEGVELHRGVPAHLLHRRISPDQIWLIEMYGNDGVFANVALPPPFGLNYQASLDRP